MLDCTSSYGHDVYIGEQLVGYIERLGDGDAAITISGKNFARLTSDGLLLRNGVKIGEISDIGEIYFNNRLVGEIDANNDFVFYGDEL